MKRFLLTFAVGAIFLVAPNITLAAFGVSPPFFNAVHLVPGVTYSQTIYLVQDQTTSDLAIKATLSVPDHIKSWITIDKGLSFTIPAGTQQFPVQISITVPQGEALGTYSGNIVFATNPGQSGEVAIALGANVSINVVVGTGIYEEYSIPYITFPSIEEGWNPRVTYKFQNNGNVPETLDGATFELWDQYDAVRLAYLTKNDGFSAVPPFTTQEYTIEFPTDFHLGVGDYWGVVNFYKNNQVVASQKTILHVLPRGSLSSPIDLVIENIQQYWIYYLIALIAFILIVRRVWAMRRNKRRA
jgi:hypothetical protein